MTVSVWPILRTLSIGFVRRFSSAAGKFPPSTSLTDASHWKQEISQYISYNQEYLDGERAHAEEQEKKRKSLPRKEKIRRGQLAKIINWSFERKNVYKLIGQRKLPANNELVKGQPVELRDHNMCTKGVISQLLIGQKKRPSFIVELYDDNQIDMDDLDMDHAELEYTTDLTAYERMQKTLATIAKETYLPAWLMLSIASKTGSLESRADNLSQIVMNDTDQCVNEVKEFMEGQKETIAMNESQRAAIVNSVACALSIIQGPPGTFVGRSTLKSPTNAPKELVRHTLQQPLLILG